MTAMSKRWRVNKLEGRNSRKRDLVAEVEVTDSSFNVFYPASDSVMHSFHVEDIIGHGLQVPDLIFLDVKSVSGVKTLTLRTTTTNSKEILSAVTKLRQDASPTGAVDVVLLRGWLEKKRHRFPRFFQRRFCVIKQCNRGGLYDILFEYFDAQPSGTQRERYDPLGWVDITNARRPEMHGCGLTLYGRQMNKDREREYTFKCDGKAAATLWYSSVNFGMNTVKAMERDQITDSGTPTLRGPSSNGSDNAGRVLADSASGIDSQRASGTDDVEFGGGRGADKRREDQRQKNMDLHNPVSPPLCASGRASFSVNKDASPAKNASASHASNVGGNNGRSQGGRRRQTIQTMDITMDDPAMSDALDDLDALQLEGHGHGNKPGRTGSKCGPVSYTYEFCILPGFDPIDKNYRKECQDSACLIERFGSADHPAAFIGVFDGHGQNGRKVSTFVKRDFPEMVIKHASYPHDIPRVFSDCCPAIEAELTKTAFDVRLSGTTATFMVLDEEVAHVGWCGDSRAVLGVFDSDTQTYKAVDLTQDHKPTDDAEKTRIECHGGMVMKVSEDSEDTGIPARVFDRQRPHFGPGIAMSRSIGDTNATALGVIPEPDYHCHHISADDGFMIFASDGLWEVFTSAEAVAWVTKYLSKMEEKGIVPGQTSDTEHLIVSQNLAEEAQRRWVVSFNAQEVVDDTTVMIVFININSKYRSTRGGRGSIVQDFSAYTTKA